MNETDELQATVRRHDTDIVQLLANDRMHTQSIRRLESISERHSETLSTLRALVAGLATKDDMLALRTDLDRQHAESLRDAHNSVPVKASLVVTGGMFLISLVGLVVGIMMRHA